MTRILTRVLLRAVLVAVGVVFATFILLAIVPGDISAALLGGRATPERVAEIRAQFGLDDPWYLRLVHYFGELFTGGGKSFVSAVPVSDLISARIAPTMTIVALALIMAMIMASLLALAAAAHHNGPIDQLIRIITTTGVAVPSFLLGMLLILLFGVWLKWLPVGGTQAGFVSFLLPSFTAAFAIIPVVVRSLRVQLLEVSRADYITAARSTGLSERRVTWAYLLPNAAVPAITLIGLNVAYLIGGTFIVEKVFAIDGLGTLMFDAIRDRDVPVVRGVVLFTAVIVVVVNAAAELAVEALDPRRREATR